VIRWADPQVFGLQAFSSRDTASQERKDTGVKPHILVDDHPLYTEAAVAILAKVGRVEAVEAPPTAAEAVAS
jgi:hypothetical protein